MSDFIADDPNAPQAIRKLKPGKLVIASHNPGKIREIRALLAPYGIEPVSAADLDLPEPEETGTTFIANAELKAMQAADLSGLPALSDDSGLCVDALLGEPGIFSARWAGPEKDFGAAMGTVWQKLEATGPDASRSAHFVCALALAWPDGHVEAFEGRVDGTLVWPPRGNNGFGYDAMFVPLGHDVSFGEMDPDAKHAMSHRADAFAKFVAAVF
ncbi:RdgB/HAM1 family non-canonical purine NTP pyrophosphatase [Sphingobium sp.]|uniref:RdgB/HAM1 family non-canonical purine NTP pyrophosphatase n=1 Tax=Sphingobium sp. TaxID=1912891 RepID=UPI0039B88F9A